MELVKREYLYKSCDFLNKELFYEKNFRFIKNEWKLHNNIYADGVLVDLFLNREIIKISDSFHRLRFDEFKELYIQQKMEKKDGRYFISAIYQEWKYPKYEFNKIWKDL